MSTILNLMLLVLGGVCDVTPMGSDGAQFTADCSSVVAEEALLAGQQESPDQLMIRLFGAGDVHVRWSGQTAQAVSPGQTQRTQERYFEIPAGPGLTDLLEITVDGVSFAPPLVEMASQNELAAVAQRRDVRYGIYSGILLSVACLCLLAFVVARLKGYLWFAGFTLSAWLTLAGISGRGLPVMDILLGSRGQLQAGLVSNLIVWTMLAFFVRAYLGSTFKKLHPIAWRAFLFVGLGGLIVIPLAFIDLQAMLVSMAVINLLASLVLATALTRFALDGMTRARTLLTAVMPLLVGVMLGSVHVLSGRFSGFELARLLMLSGLVFFPMVIIVAQYRRYRELRRDAQSLKGALMSSQRLALLRSHYCRVTGLPRRSRLVEMFRELTTADGSELIRMGVFLIHIDSLIEIRQRYGRAMLEQVVVDVAAALRDGLDVGQIIGRLEDWELIVVIPMKQGEHLKDRLTGAGENIQRCLGNLTTHTEPPIPVGVSLGLSVWPIHGTSLDELVRKADSALYDAQTGGGNRICLYDEQKYLSRAESWQQIDNLKAALAANEFELHYQPIHESTSGRLRGFEALLRWRRDGQLIGPDAFLHLLTDDMVLDFGYWTLAQIVEDVRWMDKAGIAPEFVCLNIAPRVLVGSGFPAQMKAATQRAGLAPGRIHLEITENDLVENWSRARHALEVLQAAGTPVYVDDFGVGYSSLSYLRELPVAGLKIDRSFVSRIGKTDQDEALLAGILRLAGTLDLRVIAEGVETRDQAAFLRNRGCDELQGHFFAMAMPIDELVDYVQTRRSA